MTYQRIPDLLQAVVDWHGRRHERAAATSVDMRLTGPTVGRAKDSVALQIVAEDRLISVTVWDSGEYEEITVRVVGEADSLVAVDEPVVAVEEFGDVDGVVGRLNRLLAEAAP